MNRELLFRGKRRDSCEWVIGAHIPYLTGDPVILELDPIRANIVDPVTVGQYTGLVDKNGKKIFEGDQLEFVYHESYFKGVVYFVDGSFYLKRNSSDIIVYTHLKDAVNKLYAYVIGNIYDNPENIGVNVNDSVEGAR